MDEVTRGDIGIYFFTIFPLLILIPGHLIFMSFFGKTKEMPFDFYQRIFLKILLTMILSSSIGLVLFSLGCFKMLYLIYGNLVISLLFTIIKKYKITHIYPISWGIQPWQAIFVVILILGMFLHYRPNEIYFGDSIQAWNAQFGFYLSKSGKWNIWNDFNISKLPLFSMWLTYFSSLFGPKVMFYANSIFSSILILAAYSFGKFLVNRCFGLLFCMFFAFHWQSIWQSHHNLANTLDLVWIFGFLISIINIKNINFNFWSVLGLICALFSLITHPVSVFILIFIGLIFLIIKKQEGSLPGEHSSYFKIILLAIGISVEYYLFKINNGFHLLYFSLPVIWIVFSFYLEHLFKQKLLFKYLVILFMLFSFGGLLLAKQKDLFSRGSHGEYDFAKDIHEEISKADWVYSDDNSIVSLFYYLFHFEINSLVGDQNDINSEKMFIIDDLIQKGQTVYYIQSKNDWAKEFFVTKTKSILSIRNKLEKSDNIVSILEIEGINDEAFCSDSCL